MAGCCAGSGSISELPDIVEEAYRVFKRPRPAADGVCECCMYPDVKARLLDWEPREIPNYAIRDWFFAASNTPFPLNVIRWFLPRILEGLARSEDMAAVGEEVLLHRLGMAGFPEMFTEPKIKVVDRFAMTYLEAVLAGAQKPLDLDTTLCMFALGGIDLTPLIERLDSAPIDAVIDSMRERSIGIEIGFTAFWESGPAKDVALGWFASDWTIERLMAFAAGTAGTEDQCKAAWALASRALEHLVILQRLDECREY